MAAANGEIIWHLKALPLATVRALNHLSAEDWLKKSKWYLAGGTALALQVGHRSSVDLDFFSPDGDFDVQNVVRKFPKSEWATTLMREGTLYGKLFNAKVSFIAYPFFRPDVPYQKYGSVRVLHPDDIAVMKVIAISQRGRKRDFVDLYWYCKNMGRLIDVVKCLPHQYPHTAHNYHHIIKSLTYFIDADPDPMPKLFFDATWNEIKIFFKKEVPRVAKEFLNL